MGLQTGIYLVFMDNSIRNPNVKEDKEIIEGVEIATYIVRYDVEKDFTEDLRKTEKRTTKKIKN